MSGGLPIFLIHRRQTPWKQLGNTATNMTSKTVGMKMQHQFAVPLHDLYRISVNDGVEAQETVTLAVKNLRRKMDGRCEERDRSQYDAFVRLISLRVPLDPALLAPPASGPHDMKRKSADDRKLDPQGGMQAGPAQVSGLNSIDADDEDRVREAVRLTYKLTVNRDAVPEEVEIWLNHFRDGLAFDQFLSGMAGSEEAKNTYSSLALDDDKSDGNFVIDLYRHIFRRGCMFHELDTQLRRLRSGAASRADLVLEFFSEAQRLDALGADEAVHDGLSCGIMGTGRRLTVAEWRAKAEDKSALKAAREDLKVHRPFVLKGDPEVRVTAIASLYKGGDFVEQFMDNITGQTCFDRYCELIIVDANSPEDEGEVIRRYLKSHPSVRYERTSTTIGIYDAWNLALRMAKGRYITNSNLDDLRREDSFEIQAGALDEMPFVDVVYQDFYYTFDPLLSWEEVASFGYKSRLPIVTACNMLAFNSPHNAPMWRRSLHDELGYFEKYYQSAGDYEFWLRCLSAGKFFYKVNEPHVVYYQNPKGLSTRADSKGIVEAMEISRKYAPKLIPESYKGHFEDFFEEAHGERLDASGLGELSRYEIVQRSLRNAAANFKEGGQ